MNPFGIDASKWVKMFLRHFVVMALLLPSVSPALLAFEAEPQDPLLEQPNDTLANNYVKFWKEAKDRDYLAALHACNKGKQPPEPDSVVVKEKPKDLFCEYVLLLAVVGFLISWSIVIWWLV